MLPFRIPKLRSVGKGCRGLQSDLASFREFLPNRLLVAAILAYLEAHFYTVDTGRVECDAVRLGGGHVVSVRVAESSRDYGTPNAGVTLNRTAIVESLPARRQRPRRVAISLATPELQKLFGNGRISAILDEVAYREDAPDLISEYLLNAYRTTEDQLEEDLSERLSRLNEGAASAQLRRGFRKTLALKGLGEDLADQVDIFVGDLKTAVHLVDGGRRRILQAYGKNRVPTGSTARLASAEALSDVLATSRTFTFMALTSHPTDFKRFRPCDSKAVNTLQLRRNHAFRFESEMSILTIGVSNGLYLAIVSPAEVGELLLPYRNRIRKPFCDMSDGTTSAIREVLRRCDL